MILNGFVKLKRSILNWEWYGNLYMTRLFMHLIFTVNYEEKAWCGERIKRGERVVTLQGLADETGISKGEISKLLKKLEKSGEVLRRPTGRYTIVTLINYDEYVDTETEENPCENSPKTEEKRTVTQCNKYNNKNKKNNYNNKPVKSKISFDIDELEESSYLRYKKNTKAADK